MEDVFFFSALLQNKSLKINKSTTHQNTPDINIDQNLPDQCNMMNLCGVRTGIQIHTKFLHLSTINTSKKKTMTELELESIQLYVYKLG